MAEKSPSNVKIYDRPERKRPSPLLLVIGIVIAIIAGFFIYKALFSSAIPAKAPTGFVNVSLMIEQMRQIR